MKGFQVGPQTFITVRYQVCDAEGEAASEPEVIGYVFGMGGLLPAVERALDGKMVGDQLDLRLSEKQAYGPRNPKAILEVDRSDFPQDVQAGDRFEVENDDGGLLILHVLDVQSDFVVVDTNHPLAGQEVGIKMEVLDVRAATEEEVEAAELCLKDDLEDGLRRDQERGGLVPDVRPADLIRRRS